MAKIGASVFFIALFAGTVFEGKSQFHSLKSSYWKKYSDEITGHFGGSHFLGELGGRDRIGSDFIYDLELNQTRPAFGLQYRKFVQKNHALTFSLWYAQVSGADSLTDEPFRNNRNLHFKSNIFEATLRYEYHISISTIGNLYGIGSRKARAKFSANNFYFFAGVGVFHFNPKANPSANLGGDFDDKWVELQPLGTEGQGLNDSLDFYNRTQVMLPMGLGYRYGLSRSLFIGIELAYRNTFTDYIDDVSTDYPNKEELRSERENGDLAVGLADPSKGDIHVPAQGYNEGAQRGDPTDNDAYFFTTFSITYKLGMRTSKSQHRKGIKLKRRTRAKF